MLQMHNSGRPAYITAMIALFLFSGGGVRTVAAQSAKVSTFPVASVHLEQNVTDGDMEVVFKAKGEDDGLTNLKVVSPDGRTVINFTAPDSSTLGMRQFSVESPEPKDVKALKAAYPEGVYEFTGRTSSGAAFVGKSTLSHRLPAIVKIKTPAPKSKEVSIKDLKISWGAVPGVTSYIVELEQDELKIKIVAELPGTSTSLAVPNGFLVAGKEYDLGIGAVAEGGNISFMETKFTTNK